MCSNHSWYTVSKMCFITLACQLEDLARTRAGASGSGAAGAGPSRDAAVLSGAPELPDHHGAPCRISPTSVLRLYAGADSAIYRSRVSRRKARTGAVAEGLK